MGQKNIRIDQEDAELLGLLLGKEITRLREARIAMVAAQCLPEQVYFLNAAEERIKSLQKIKGGIIEKFPEVI